MSAARLEQQAWDGSEQMAEVPAAAVSVVPGRAGAGPRRAVPAPAPAGADLAAVLGDDEPGCLPGRHREDRPVWTLLRRLPGWRPATPDDASDSPDTDGPDTDGRDTDGRDTDGPGDGGNVAVDDGVGADGPDTDGSGGSAPQAPDAAPGTDAADEPLDDELAAAADLGVPAQRSGSHPAADEPWYRARRRRSPAPSLRADLQAAGVRLQRAPDRAAIARTAAEEAARLVGADVSALVLRAVEGPRVLGLHPGGPDSGDLWGPATLAALLGVGHPVRRVVEGDPLAGGRATALLAVPVPTGGTIAGTLLARRREPRAFTATEQDVLARLARMTGAALLAGERRTAFERGEADPVTRLPGGRRLATDVAAAVRTAERHALPVTVLAAHVEGLAHLRTEVGPSPADGVLARLARELPGVLRVGDVAYRIGEDEFALLLPATDADAVPALLARLEAVTAEVVAGLALPGGPRRLLLRTAQVPLDAVRAGADAVDASLRALELDRQKIRWTRPVPGAVDDGSVVAQR